MKTAKAAIQAIAKASATVISILLWPLAMPIAKLNKAIRPKIRQAFRERDFRRYIALTMWRSPIFIGLAVWIASSTPPYPGLSLFWFWMKKFVRDLIKARER